MTDDITTRIKNDVGTWEQGVLDDQGGDYPHQLRIRTKGSIPLHKDDEVLFYANGQYYLWFLLKNGTVLDHSSWIATDNVLTISQDCELRVTLKKSNGAESFSPDERTTSVSIVSSVARAINSIVETTDTLTNKTKILYSNSAMIVSGDGATIGIIANFINSGLDDSGNLYAAQKYRICTPEFVTMLFDCTFSIAPGFYLFVGTLNDGQYTSNLYDGTGALSAGINYKFVIRRIVENYSEIAGVYEFTNAVQIASKLNDDLKNAKESSVFAIDNVLGIYNHIELNIANFCNFTNGGFTQEGDIYLPEKYRVTSVQDLKCGFDYSLIVGNGFQLFVNTKNSESIYSPTRYISGTKVDIAKGTSCRFTIRRTSENTEETADINEFTNAITIHPVLYNEIVNYQNQMASALTNGSVSIIKLGSFISAGLADITPYYPQTWRVSSYPPLKTYNGIRVTVKDGFRVFYRGITNGIYDSSKDKGYSPGSIFTIPEKEEFSIVISRVTEDQSETADIVEFTNAVQIAPIYLNNNARKNQNIKFVAHQGYSLVDTYGRSIADNYYNAAKHGFDFGECDIKFTGDSLPVPVCCHDLSFMSNGETITISEHTLSELKTYDYYGSKISTLEEVLMACKLAGIGLFIDHMGSGNSEAQWNSIYNLVKKIRISDLYWTISDSNKMTEIVTILGKATFVWNIMNNNDLTSIIDRANEEASEQKIIVLACNYAGISVANIISAKELISNPNVLFCVWTVDDTVTINNYLPYVDYIVSNKVSYPMMML